MRMILLQRRSSRYLCCSSTCLMWMCAHSCASWASGRRPAPSLDSEGTVLSDREENNELSIAAEPDANGCAAASPLRLRSGDIFVRRQHGLCVTFKKAMCVCVVCSMYCGTPDRRPHCYSRATPSSAWCQWLCCLAPPPPVRHTTCSWHLWCTQYGLCVTFRKAAWGLQRILFVCFIA